MRFLRARNPYLQFAVAFFALVLVPSFLLGWFSLRAVESERAVAHRKLLDDERLFAQVAVLQVRNELEVMEATWEALVPRAVGWESHLDDLRSSLDAARGQAFVRACHLLHVSGRRLYPAADTTYAAAALTAVPPAADAAQAERFHDLLATAEAAEFDSNEPDIALQAYRRILAGSPTPNLAAIAHAGIGRVLLQRGDRDLALREYAEVLQYYPDARDLDNQPLRLQAQLQIARVQEAKGESLAAAQTLTSLYEDMVAHSDEISSLQYGILVERIDERMARLVPRPVPPAWEEVERRYAAARVRPKQQVSSDYFMHKLSRKLVRASLDGLPYSTQPRYLSDTVDGQPFLLVYLYLPDASGTAVAGVAGFEIDLHALSRVLFPEILRRLQPASNLGLAVVDDTGQPVIGSATPAETAAVFTSNLGVPFDFWGVAVFQRAAVAGSPSIDFRARVYLYAVLLLLIAIVTGAGLVVAGMRRESKLARQKTSFVSSVSHELRTPLTSIRMYTEMLEMGAERMGSADRGRCLEIIRRECERLQRLIDTVLDFSRIERGAKQYRFDYEEIGALVRGIAEEFRAQAEAEGCRYEVSIEPDLPELRVDVDAVRQMLLNLLSNAVKYSDTEREIRVRVFRRDTEVGVEVQDRGIGIDPEEHERIFDDFYRVDTRLTSRRSGVGLGLPLVRRLAAAHGGRVSVESQRGSGSRFTVWLPVEPSPGSPGAAGAAISSRASSLAPP